MNALPKAATRQFAGLVLAPVDPARIDELRQLLAQVAQETNDTMRGHPPEHPVVPFGALATVHYARFILLEPPQVERATLVFGTDYDGPEGRDRCSETEAWRRHVLDLQSGAGEGLARIFGCCQGFRAGELARFLRRHRRSASTFYVGSSGRSKRQILEEADLRRRAEKILDESAPAGEGPEKVRERIARALADQGLAIAPFPPQPDLSGVVERGAVGAGAVALAAVVTLAWAASRFVQPALLGWLVGLGSLGGLAVFAVAYFRHLENTDPQFQPEYSGRTQARSAVSSTDENQFLQNQLTHLVPIKPGLLRWLLIRVVFAVLQVLATNVHNKGKLGGIPSIHFARWTLVPNRGVLFFSNFDSSWQSYLGDFIDQASSGLTAVWSNTVGYPRTRWLVSAGSRDASRFLAWTREHQLPTQVWYCAYPGLSIVNVNDNTEIRRGLADPSLDAASWLFRLRNVDRVHTDQLFGEEKQREPTLPLKDIQGLVLWGYGHMPEARYLLLRVPQDPSPAARTAMESWLGALPVNSADNADDEPAEPLLNLAFSYRGLSLLGVDPRIADAFSTAFCEDSDHPYRARVNGDAGPSAPERWEWGSGERAAHIVLFLYAKTKKSAAAFAQAYIEQAQTAGLALVRVLDATTLQGRKEHFGFRDGIAQPTVQGSGRVELVDNTVAAGEFLLGHRDGYGNVTHSPESPSGFNVGRNGSYLVLRQLEQDVEEFWRYCAAQGNGAAVSLASKMVGRWPSGAPLLRHPDRDPEDARASDDDNFTYIANDEDNDRYGARCPFGAHVRRSNPRDWQLGETRAESLRLANLHRILRRGRPYGEPLDPAMSIPAMIERAQQGNEAPEGNGAASNGTPNGKVMPVGHGTPPAQRGLQFLCFNANIDRQFEFIQQQWCNNPKFAGLTNDPDPLLGVQQRAGEVGLDGAGFTRQSDVHTGLVARSGELPRFVRVVGSGYFFMPSLPALRLLGAGLLCASDAPTLESVPPDEQLHIDNLIANLGNKMKRDYAGTRTLRDAHPKMHGCLRASFRVEQSLAPELAVGLFARARTYDAWVRFSSGTKFDDRERDVRGAAIKLLGVGGFKLLEGEESCTTHDLVTLSHDTFMARDVAQFDALIQAFVAGSLAVALYCATHWRTAVGLRQSMQHHTNPIAISYFGVVPYLLGTRAVHYALRPTQVTAAQVAEGPDQLREALKKSLAEGGASFDFLVQLRTHPDRMPIEDPSVAWPESDSPFRKVATLEIPAQEFDTAPRRDFGDNLSFNPWRCLPEHRPLGGISRARRQVYRALSSLRHGRNGAAQVEPTADPLARESSEHDGRPVPSSGGAGAPPGATPMAARSQ